MGVGPAAAFSPEVLDARNRVVSYLASPGWATGGFVRDNSERQVAGNLPIWALLLTAGPVMFRHLQVAGLQGDVLPRLALSPAIRTVDTDRLAYVEAAWRWLAQITQTDLKEPWWAPKALEALTGHFYTVVEEIENLLLEGGRLPQLIFESIQNTLWGDTHTVYVVRMHINMTTANQVDDHQGLVGDTLREKTYEWLARRFGASNVFLDAAGTSFLIRVGSFEQARQVLGQYRHEVGLMVYRALAERYEIDWERMALFRPRHTAFGMSVANHDYKRGKGKSQPLREAILIERIQSLLFSLAVATTYLEKFPPPAAGSNPLYTTRDLPGVGDDGYAQLAAMKERAASYVPAGIYGVAPRPDEHPLLVHHPRYRRLTGHLSRTVRDGGLVERFERVVGVLLAAPDDAQAFADFQRFVVSPAEEALQIGALGVGLDGTLGDLLRVGSLGRTFPTYPRLLKPVQVHRGATGEAEFSNFFAEEMAHRRYVHFAVSEVDGAKAFFNRHPPGFDVDADFQRLREVWFDVAVEIGMVDGQGNPRLIIAPFQGDQIAVGFDPGEIDPRSYLQAVQEKIHREFAGKPFQREQKVRREGHDARGRPVVEYLRWPLWKRPGRAGQRTIYQIAAEQPRGYQPLMGSLTVTTIWAPLPRPIEREGDPARLMLLFREMGSEIDGTLKESRGRAFAHLPGGREGVWFPLHKEALGLFSNPIDWGES